MAHHKYGDRVTVYFLSRRHIFLNDQATFLNQIAKDPAFTLGFPDDLDHDIGGMRWECVRNEDRKRAIIQQYHEFLFGQELFALNHKTCEYLIKRLVGDQLPSSSFKIVNLFDYLGEIVFDTAVTVLYGETFAQSQSDLYASCRTFENAVATVMLNVPFKSFFLRSALRQRDQFIERFLNLTPADDMSKLVLARIELTQSLDDGRTCNVRDRAAHHALLLWTAIVNTVPAACWSLVDLLLHPDVLEAVKDELNTKVKSIESLFEKQTIGELHLLDSCIQETMRRIFPSMTLRQAAENTSVTCTDGTQMGVRKNDVIIYPALVKHFDSKVSLNFTLSLSCKYFSRKVYDHPYEYRHDRFVKQQLKAPPLLLFGTGSRMCPGRYWAINEIKMLLAIILSKLDIELLMNEDYKEKMRTRLECQLSRVFLNMGPHEKDKHQFRMRYSIRK